MSEATSGASSTAPKVGFVVPVYNAGASLDRTMNSLLAQTVTNWAALLVDDGSTDDSGARADAWAARDPRVRVIHRANGGASAARNTALAALETPYIVFVDADDWIAPEHLETLLPIAEQAGEDALSYCSYVRVTADDSPLPPDWCPDLMNDAFEVLAHRCEPAIHCVVARREHITGVGGFDEALKTCEDWDLWQRMARQGIRFVGTPVPLAFYRMRDGSLSTRYETVEQDAMVVFARGATSDPRVINPDPRFAGGSRSAAAVLTTSKAAYEAGVASAAGSGAALPLLDPTEADPAIADAVAERFVAGWLSVRSGERPAAEGDAVLAALDDLWRAQGTAAPSPTVRAGMILQVRNRLFALDTLDPPQPIGRWLGVAASIEALAPIDPPAGVDGLHVKLSARGTPIGSVELPVFGTVAAATIGRAAVAQLSVKAISRALATSPRFLAATLRSLSGLGPSAVRGDIVGRPGFKRTRSGLVRQVLAGAADRAIGEGAARGSTDGESLARDRAVILAGAAKAATSGPAIEPVTIHVEEKDIAEGRKDYWEHIFASADPWLYDSPYEAEKYERTLDLVKRERVTNALELACAEGHFTRRLAGAVDKLLSTDISENALGRAAERCREHDNLSFQQLDFFGREIPGGRDLILCSEVLYFAEDEAQLAHIATKIAGALVDGGRLVTGHAFVLAEDQSHTGFDWGDQFGVKRINAAFEAAGLVLEEQVRTDLYRVSAFRKTDRATAPAPIITDMAMTDDLEVELKRFIVFGGAPTLRSDVIDEVQLRVPILAYPPIDGRDGAIEQLGQHLRYLRSHGYSSISLAELLRLQQRGRATQGRRVVLLVDDAAPETVRDVLKPLFESHDFSAVFGIAADRLQAHDEAVGGVVATLTAAHFEWAVRGDTLPLEASMEHALEMVASAAGRIGAFTDSSQVFAHLADWTYDPRIPELLRYAGYSASIGPAPGFVDLERRDPMWRRIAIDPTDGTGMLCEKLRQDRSSAA